METKQIWDKTTQDFGKCTPNSLQHTTFTYLGDVEMNNNDFKVSCGCTTPVYNANTKVLEVSLQMPSFGEKSAFIQCLKLGMNLLLKGKI